MQRILAHTLTDRPCDIRDRAILMLLAVYGMRRGEVAALRIDQVDWRERLLRLFRLKRRQPQLYPLLPSVAEALSPLHRYGSPVHIASGSVHWTALAAAPLTPGGHLQRRQSQV